MTDTLPAAFDLGYAVGSRAVFKSFHGTVIARAQTRSGFVVYVFETDSGRLFMLPGSSLGYEDDGYPD